jgi:hypothetical protein
MANYVVTPIWGRTWVGASESYISPDLSPTAAQSAIGTLLELRAALMHTDAYWQGVRISLYGSKRRSSVLLPPSDLFPDVGVTIPIPANGTYGGSGNTAGPTIMRNSLQYTAYFDTNRPAKRYLADIPAGIVGSEPATYNFGRVGDWNTAFKAFTDYLKNNSWQIRAIDKSGSNPAYSVVNVVQQTASPGLLGLVLTAGGPLSFLAGQKIFVQGFRPAKGTRLPTLNGTWTVASIDGTGLPALATVYLRNSAGLSPDAQRFTPNSIVRAVRYALYPIQQSIGKRVVTHKRGKPSLGYRGRRLTIVSLDP